MIKGLWNVGVKVAGLDAEIAFFLSTPKIMNRSAVFLARFRPPRFTVLGALKVGTDLVLRENLPVRDQVLDYAILTIGGVRLLLFPKLIFEDPVEGGSGRA